MANAMGEGKFRPPQLRNCLTDFDETRTITTPETTHHAKFHFDSITSVVSANAQFATVQFLFCLPFFFWSLSHAQVAPVD